MATPALAIVDFGPTYLVGLLRAIYLLSCYVTTRLVLVAIVLVTEQRSVPGEAYACALLIA